MSAMAFRSEEAVTASLRALYEAHGYAPFKMSKFEPYELYVRNKDFLISDGVITFTDTNGTLLALKPDVTLSIVRASRDLEPGTVRKVYYNEHVYRVSSGTHTFGELMQSGLECIGDVDAYSLTEVITLAMAALSRISDDAVLDISHLGIVTSLLDEADGPQEVRRTVLHCLAEKNTHELQRVCLDQGFTASVTDSLMQLASVTGSPEEAIERLAPILASVPDREAVTAFLGVLDALMQTPDAAMLRVDFSAIGDPKYYNGFVFRGFIRGIPERVLSGGQYDRLMRRMHSEAGAVGFAVYLDALEPLYADPDPFDADVLLLYDADASPAGVAQAVRDLQETGVRVSAQRSLPRKQRFRQIVRLENGEVKPVG